MREVYELMWKSMVQKAFRLRKQASGAQGFHCSQEDGNIQLKTRQGVGLAMRIRSGSSKSYSNSEAQASLCRFSKETSTAKT